MNADLKAYLEGADDLVILGINLVTAASNIWICDQLIDTDCRINGTSTTMTARACLAPWPARAGSGDFSTTVMIDDVDSAIFAVLDTSGYGIVSCDLYLFLDSHKSEYGEDMEPVLVMPFRVGEVSVDDYVAKLLCKRADLVNKKFPDKIYEISDFNGLNGL